MQHINHLKSVPLHIPKYLIYLNYQILHLPHIVIYLYYLYLFQFIYYYLYLHPLYFNINNLQVIPTIIIIYIPYLLLSNPYSL